MARDAQGGSFAHLTSSEALERLKRVAIELANEPAADTVLDVILAHVVAAMGANAGGIVVLNEADDHLHMVAQLNLPNTTIDVFPLSLDVKVPITDAAKSGTALWVENTAQRNRWYPLLVGEEISAVSQGVLPLLFEGRTIGVLGLTFAADCHPGEIEQTFCTVIACLCSLAVARFLAAGETTRLLS